jgi:hypothetical protein
MPLLLFCVVFGLSMDSEVFLISRIREYWVSSEQNRADNDESIALGQAYTGTAITAAALVLSIAFTALMAPQLAFMRMFGVGLTLAILVNATLVRLILVPAVARAGPRQLVGAWAASPATQSSGVGRLGQLRQARCAKPLGRPGERELSGSRDHRPTTVRLTKPLGSPGWNFDLSRQPPGRHQRDHAPNDSSIRRRVHLGAHHDGHSDLRSRQA